MEILFRHYIAIYDMIILLCLSAFFSSSETAFFSIPRQTVDELKKSSSRSSVLILELIKAPSKLLVSVLLGNLTVNILFFCISAVIAADISKTYGEFYQAIMGIIILLLVIIFGEILPKSIGLRFPLRIARVVCIPILLWQFISTPFRIFFTFIADRFKSANGNKTSSYINEDELKMLLDISEDEGKINSHAGEMIDDIIGLSSITVKHLMTPRVDVFQYSIETTIKDAISMSQKRKLYFIPVFEGNEDNTIGTIDIRKIYFEGSHGDTLAHSLTEPVFVPETKHAGKLMEEMLDSKQNMVIVVDEYGGMSGIVTLDDLFKEVLGKTHRPGVPLVTWLKRNVYRVNASLPIDNWEDFFSGSLLEFDSSDITTIGGLVMYLFGELPKKGDTISFKNLRFTIEKMGKLRIASIILTIEGDDYDLH